MNCGDVLLHGSRGYNLAYYSARPPAAPLMLIPVPPPDATSSYLDCLTTVPQSMDVVQSVLHDLITGLPMATPTRRLSPRPVRNRVERDAQYSPFSSPTIVASRSPFSRLSSASSVDANLRCSVATQAHIISSPGVPDTGVVAQGAASAWLAEARALRDCHLRLVLRQLRHVAQLNRAVDRVLAPEPTYRGEPRIAP